MMVAGHREGAKAEESKKDEGEQGGKTFFETLEYCSLWKIDDLLISGDYQLQTPCFCRD